jgi:hypothetical protein
MIGLFFNLVNIKLIHIPELDIIRAPSVFAGGRPRYVYSFECRKVPGELTFALRIVQE